MKQIYFSVILILLSISTAYSQTDYEQEHFIKHDSLIVSFSTGYSYMNTGGISDYYKDLVTQHDNLGIKRTSHSNFGSTLIIGGQFLWTRVAPPIWIGASLGYTYTPAFSQFKDDTHTSDLKGKISSYHVSFSSRFALENFSKGQLFLALKPGIGYYSMKIQETSNFTNQPQSNRQTTLSQWVPALEASLGFTIPFSRYFISYEAGYMVNITGYQKLNISSDSGDSFNISRGSCNQSGPVAVLSFGFGL